MDLRWNRVGVAAFVACFAAIAPGCGKDSPAPQQSGQAAPTGASAPAATSAAPATAAPASAPTQQASAAGTSAKPASGAGQSATAAAGSPAPGAASAPKAPAANPPAGAAATAGAKASGGSASDAPAAAAASGGDDVGGTESKDPEVRRLATLARDGRFAPYRALAKERVAAQLRLSSFQPDTSSDAALESSKKEYERLKLDLARKSDAMDSFLMSKKWTDEDYAVMGFIMSQVEAARFPG